MWNLPSLLNCILGYEDMGAKQGRETLILNAKKHCQGKFRIGIGLKWFGQDDADRVDQCVLIGVSGSGWEMPVGDLLGWCLGGCEMFWPVSGRCTG